VNPERTVGKSADAGADAAKASTDAAISDAALDGSADAASGEAGACGSGPATDCCPSDPKKTAPGVCGCGVADTDTDADGTPDCNDLCPADASKTAPGVCGCGLADVAQGCLGLRAALVHRYSFDGSGTTATDSKGTANGTVANTQLTGTGALALSGTTSNQYVDLPNNLLSTLTNATLEVWVTWTGGGVWQRIFDFGSNNYPEGQQGTGRTYLFLTPHGGSSASLNMRVTFSSSGAGAETIVSAPLDLPSARAVHVAVVVDDQNNTLALYQDGVQVGSGTFAGHLSSLNDINNWLGRSQFTSDPELGGSIDEFRMYDAALTPAQLMTSFMAGPDAAFF
jgi:hypothetical protein